MTLQELQLFPPPPRHSERGQRERVLLNFLGFQSAQEVAEVSGVIII